LFLTNFYPPNAIGGYERLCYLMASAFATRGHEVSVLTSDYGGKTEDFPGQTIERHLKLLATEGNIYQSFDCLPEERAQINARNVELLEQKVAAERPDVVFVWNLHFFDQPLLDAIQRSGRPVVFLLTDNWLIALLNGAFLRHYFTERVFSHRAPLKQMYCALARTASSLSRSRFPIRGRAIFGSEFMRSLYTEAGCSFSDATVIYHGVNFGRNGNTQFVDRSTSLTPGELHLLFAGRVVDIKGVHTAIGALPLVIRALPDYRVTLTLLGDSQDQQYVQRLQSLVREYGLSHAVVFAPAVREGELFDLFQRYDIYLFPSLYEPFSLTLIHALGAGIPTVASDIGGNVEIVRHRETGLLFPKGDAAALAAAVVDLGRDSALRCSVSRSAHQAARDYTFERMVTQVEQYLEHVS
jgi:glycosyltransferase involved in cell wall biosynthesis